MVISKKEFDSICGEIAMFFNPHNTEAYNLEKDKASLKLNKNLIFEVSVSRNECIDYLENYIKWRRGETEKFYDKNGIPYSKTICFMLDHAIYYLLNSEN